MKKLARELYEYTSELSGIHKVEGLIDALAYDPETLDELNQSLLDFGFREVQAANDVEDSRDEWRALSEDLKHCQLMSDSDAAASIFYSAFRAGALLMFLSFGDSKLREITQSLAELALRQNSKLMIRELMRDELIKSVQERASELWSEQETDGTRIGDMAQTLWGELVSAQDFRDFEPVLPNDASGLKKWLRPIAPDYAKRGGRPKGS